MTEGVLVSDPAQSTSVPGKTAALRGRQRDRTRDDALRQATIELLVESGYDRLTIDAIAARARAGKATVYRRWSSKAELVVDAVKHQYLMVDCPDTGSVRGDLEALIRGPFDDQDPEFQTRLLSGLVPALLQSDELREAFHKAFNPQLALDVIVQRGIRRSEIVAPKNPDLIGAVFPALALYQMIMSGENPTAEFRKMVLDDIVLPLLQAPAG